MAKEMIELLGSKVPAQWHPYPEYKELVAIIKYEKIKTTKRLKAILQSEMLKTSAWLGENKRGSPTINRQRVNQTKKLDGIKQCLRLVERYL